MIRRCYLFKMEKVVSSNTYSHVRLVVWRSWFPVPDDVLTHVLNDSDGYQVTDMRRIK